jgi:hypothetical protein
MAEKYAGNEHMAGMQEMTVAGLSSQSSAGCGAYQLSRVSCCCNIVKFIKNDFSVATLRALVRQQ